MVVLAAPAAGMWTDDPPVTTAGACTTCCWWARSRGFPLTPPAPPPPPSPPPFPSRSSLSLVWKRLRERRLNVRRRKPIIFPIHEARRSVPRPRKLLHTTAGAAGVLLLPPPPPPPPPRGEESLSRRGGDFRAAAQSSDWMSAAAERLRPHTNETDTDRATSGPPTIQPGVDDRTLSRKHTQPSSSSCPVLSRAPASCSAWLAVAHRLWNPGEIPSDAPQWEPLSHTGPEVVGGGRAAGEEEGSVVTSGPVPDPCCLVPLVPTGRSESTPASQVKVNQRNWTNRVICACVKAQRRTNFCSSRLADPSASVNQRHLSVTSPPGGRREGVDHSRLIVVPKVGSEVPQGSLEGFQEVLHSRMIVYVAGLYPGTAETLRPDMSQNKQSTET